MYNIKYAVCLKLEMGNDLTVQNWMMRFQILMAINEQLIVDVYRREVSVFVFLDTSSLLVNSDMAMECLCLNVCIRVSSIWYVTLPDTQHHVLLWQKQCQSSSSMWWGTNCQVLEILQVIVSFCQKDMLLLFCMQVRVGNLNFLINILRHSILNQKGIMVIVMWTPLS